jgi:hypothetical protein
MHNLLIPPSRAAPRQVRHWATAKVNEEQKATQKSTDDAVGGGRKRNKSLFVKHNSLSIPLPYSSEGFTDSSSVEPSITPSIEPSSAPSVEASAISITLPSTVPSSGARPAS